MKFVANIPYDNAEPFIRHFERARSRDATTKCLLMVPVYERRKWFKDLVAGNMWRIVRLYPRGSKLFSRPHKKRPEDVDLREDDFYTQWPVLALVFKEQDDVDFETYSCSRELE